MFRKSSQIFLLFTLLIISEFGATVQATTFQYFRFEPDELRGEGSENSIQLAELELRLGGTRVSGSGVSASNPGGNNPDGTGGNPFVQTPDKAVDGDLQTKWLDFNKGPLVVDFGQPVTVDAYAFATAGDAPERDPVEWTFYGSNDGSSWTVLDRQSSYNTTTDRNTWESPFPIGEELEIFDEPVDRVASTGYEVPGESVPFLTFYDARLTAAGNVLLSAGFSREGGEIAAQSGTYFWNGQELTEIQATEPVTKQSVDRVLRVTGRINDSGEIFLYERIEDSFNSEPDYRAEADERIVRYSPDGKTTFAREGRSAVAGEPGYSLTYVIEPGISESPLTERWRLDNRGRMAFHGRAENEEEKRFSGIFIADGNSVEVVVRDGDPSPVSETVFSGLDSIFDFGENGNLLFRAGMAGDPVDFNDDIGVFLYEPGSGIRLLAQENTDGGDSEIENTHYLKVTNSGSLFMATLDARAFSAEIWTDDLGDGLEPVLESGATAGRIPENLGFGSSARFEEFGDFTVTESGRIVFTADVEEDALFNPSSLGSGLFQWNGGSLELLLGEDTVVEDYRVGEQFTHANTDIFSNDYGDSVLVLDDVEQSGEGGQTLDQMILALPAAGNPRILMKTGTYLVLGEREVPEVRRIQGFGTNFGQMAVPALLNNRGQFLVRVHYRNGGSGLFLLPVNGPARPPLDLNVAEINAAEDEIVITVEGSPFWDISIERSIDLQTWTDAESFQLGAQGTGEATMPFSETTNYLRAVRSDP